MKKRKLSYQYLSSLCAELSFMFKSGVPIASGMSLMASRERDGEMRKVFERLGENCAQGKSFADGISDAGVFPAYMIFMVRTGETVGKLEQTFHALSEYFDYQDGIRKSIHSTVAYPVLLFAVMLAVFVLLLTMILPIFEHVMSQMGVTLSPLASFFLKIGQAISRGKWGILCVVAAIAAVCAALYAVKPARKAVSAFFNRQYVKTEMGKKLASSRFASTLYMMVSAGLSPEDAVNAIEELYVGTVFEAKMKKCREDIVCGTSLTESIEANGLLEPFYCDMLTVSFDLGTFDDMLGEVSRRCEKDAREHLDAVIGRIEPAVVIVLALCTALILFSFMLPLLNIMSAIG